MKTRAEGRTTGSAEIRIDRTEAMRALEASTDALVDAVRAHGRGDRPIPHMTWTVGQCVAHMLISDWMYADQIVGPGVTMRIDETSEVNDWSVGPAAGLDPSAIVPDMLRSTAHVLDVVRGLSEDATFTWWSGAEARVETAIGLLVGERLVHGWDISRALDMPWPIDPGHASIAMAASFAAMPLIVDEAAASGMNAVFEMSLRGHERYELRFTDGNLVTSHAGRARDVDCRISADPVALLLTGYGRVPQWRAIVRGRLLAWGRRPWVGLRLGRVLRNP
jgi:uncharacterized protein (TIGR03083 family)